jgi:AcrR family transcriptional regulator
MVHDAKISEKPQGPGRPRSEAARVAILEAAYDLVIARGYADITTADIAAAAGAGKQTIYRWWASKAVLVLDALQHRGTVEIDPEQPSDQSLEGFLRRVCEGATRAGPVLRSLMAEAQFDAKLRAELKVRLIDCRRAALRRMLIKWGIADEHRREALVFALYGGLWYRLLLDEPLDDVFVSGMMALAAPPRV